MPSVVRLWIDGMIDILGLHAALSDYHDEMRNNNDENNEIQNINAEDGNKLSYNIFANNFVMD